MTILNKIQDGLQSSYNVIGAQGLRAIVAAGKIGIGFCINDKTMMGAGFLQGVAACSTSLVSTSPNITAAAIIAESALINGLSFSNQYTQTLMNKGYNVSSYCSKSAPASADEPKPVEKDIHSKPADIKSENNDGIAHFNTTNYLKLAGLVAVDAGVEGLILFMNQYDTCEVDADAVHISGSFDF